MRQGRAGPLWWLKQAAEGGNTQCDLSERKSLSKVVETLSCRKLDVCCTQETIFSGGNCFTFKGKDTRYKLYWFVNDKGIAGVGVFVAREWIEKVFEVQRVSNRILLVELIVGQRVINILFVYAPQGGLVKELDRGKCMMGLGMAGWNQMLRVIEP